MAVPKVAAMKFGSTLLVATALALCWACSSRTTSKPSGCTPGQQSACRCDDGTQSQQTCNADGMAFGACRCGTGGTSSAGGAPSGGAASGGAASGGSGGAASGGSGGDVPTSGGSAGESGAASGGGGDGGSGGADPCGNGVLEPFEECDSGDGCTNCSLDNFECNPLTGAGCPGGETCVFTEDGTFECQIATASGAIGAECLDLFDSRACKTGLACITAIDSNECEIDACCTEYCKLADDDWACSRAEATCVAWWAANPPPGLDWLGHCY